VAAEIPFQTEVLHSVTPCYFEMMLEKHFSKRAAVTLFIKRGAQQHPAYHTEVLCCSSPSAVLKEHLPILRCCRKFFFILRAAGKLSCSILQQEYRHKLILVRCRKENSFTDVMFEQLPMYCRKYFFTLTSSRNTFP
jgi:hypothetical protein